MVNTSQTSKCRLTKVDKDWITLLGQHIKTNMQTPMEWGVFDCVMWATSCVKVTTGVDYYEPFEGKYDTAAGAAKVLLGEAESISALCEKYFGEEKHVAFAVTGDIVKASVNKIQQDAEYNSVFNCALGIAYGGMAYFVGDEGLVVYPLLEMDGCYNV
jgi:hypothetical protein